MRKMQIKNGIRFFIYIAYFDELFFYYLEFDFACVVRDVETPQGRSSEVTPRVSLGMHARRTASVQTASVGTKVKDGAKILKNEPKGWKPN